MKNIERQIEALAAKRIPAGEWRKVRTKMEAIRRLQAKKPRRRLAFDPDLPF